MKLKCALENLKSVFDSYSPLWEFWRIYKFNDLTEEDIYVVEVYRRKNFIADIDDLLMFYAKPHFVESVTTKLREGLKAFHAWQPISRESVRALNSREILAVIITLGGLYGACAKLYINNEIKAHQFIIECFEQCHNETMIKYFGQQLTQNIIDYKKKTYFLKEMPAQSSPGKSISI